ncbi:MAG: CDP-alcohol phosphatidyltransferase family protein [Dehalococcoidales bacterium]|jgi:CDP-diacylglycerol--glycerol-3-phosphate 3-phosphatidyltransferase
MASLEGARRTLGKYFADPVVTVLEKTHITPNALTVIGMLITFVAAALVALKHPFAAGWVVLFAGLFDMLDGALARRTNKVSKFGGVLDSTLDRISEASVLIGIAVFYANRQSVWGVAIAGITLIGSQLPSYIRSKAENLNINGKIGLFTRPERVIILALGLLLAGITNVLLIALIIIAVLSFLTAGQRLVHIWNKTKSG